MDEGRESSRYREYPIRSLYYMEWTFYNREQQISSSVTYHWSQVDTFHSSPVEQLNVISGESSKMHKIHVLK